MSCWSAIRARATGSSSQKAATSTSGSDLNPAMNYSPRLPAMPIFSSRFSVTSTSQGPSVGCFGAFYLATEGTFVRADSRAVSLNRRCSSSRHAMKLRQSASWGALAEPGLGEANCVGDQPWGYLEVAGASQPSAVAERLLTHRTDSAKRYFWLARWRTWRMRWMAVTLLKIASTQSAGTSRPSSSPSASKIRRSGRCSQPTSPRNPRPSARARA